MYGKGDVYAWRVGTRHGSGRRWLWLLDSQQVLLGGHPGGKGFQELIGEGGLASHVCVFNVGEVGHCPCG